MGEYICGTATVSHLICEWFFAFSIGEDWKGFTNETKFGNATLKKFIAVRVRKRG